MPLPANVDDVVQFSDVVGVKLTSPPTVIEAGTAYVGSLIAPATWDQLLDLRGTLAAGGVISTVSIRRVGLVGSTYAIPADQPAGAIATIIVQEIP